MTGTRVVAAALMFITTTILLAEQYAEAQSTPSTLYRKQWTHQGPNYSNDLYFPDSGTADGNHIHERSVKGMHLPLPRDRFATSCGEDNTRVSCSVAHIGGGGHCESVSWADPDDPTDCGCVVHVGANGAEWNQRCQIVVTVQHHTHSAMSMIPNYVVDTVVYAPPGSAGRGTTSSVDYAHGSKAGTSVSLSKSFKAGVSVKVSAGLGIVNIGGSFDASIASKDQSSLELRKSTTDTIKITGSTADGIDHNRDMIYLTLRPHITADILDGGQVTWRIQNQRDTQSRFVYVGWLRDEAAFIRAAKDTHDALAAAGITSAEYPNILARDPMANGQRIDETRYTFLRTLPYEPPYAPGDTTQPWSFSLGNEATQGYNHTLEDQYSVGATISGGAGVVNASASASVTWGSSMTTANAQTGSQSATVTIGGPSYGYAGSQNVSVYWDNIYGTFMFDDRADASAARAANAIDGTVTQHGAPVAHRLVQLWTGRKTLRTFTNSRGRYHFKADLPGNASVSVSGVTRPVSGAIIDIELQPRDVKYVFGYDAAGPCWSTQVPATRASEPPKCPAGYIEAAVGATTANCANGHCSCTNWIDCAHQATVPWGCSGSTTPWLPIKVRKCAR